LDVKVATAALLFSICLFSQNSRGGGAITSFARQSLGLDLSSIPFGAAAPGAEDYKPTQAPPSETYGNFATNVNWMSNSLSEKYHHKFANRILRFGFSDGKLSAIRLSISAFAGRPADSSQREISTFIDRQRKELIKIQDRLRSANPAHHLNFSDGTFQTHYAALCSPAPDSLLLMELEIAPAPPKK
jgi:hypothetical protein